MSVIGWKLEAESGGLMREGDGGEGVAVTKYHRGGVLAIDEVGGVDVDVGMGRVETV